MSAWRGLRGYYELARRSRNEDAKIVYTRHLSEFLTDLSFNELAKRARCAATIEEAESVLDAVEKLLAEVKEYEQV